MPIDHRMSGIMILPSGRIYDRTSGIMILVDECMTECEWTVILVVVVVQVTFFFFFFFCDEKWNKNLVQFGNPTILKKKKNSP
jgi:hypothetical protein